MLGRAWLTLLVVFFSIACFCRGAFVTAPRLISDVEHDAPAEDISRSFRMAQRKSAIFIDYDNTISPAPYSQIARDHTQDILWNLRLLAAAGVEVYIISQQPVMSLLKRFEFCDGPGHVHLVGEGGSAILSPGKRVRARRNSVDLFAKGKLRLLHQSIENVKSLLGYDADATMSGIVGQFGHGMMFNENIPESQLPFLDEAFRRMLVTSDDQIIRGLQYRRDEGSRFATFQNPAVNKGEFVSSILGNGRAYDAALSLGDEMPDEKMHEIINQHDGLFLSMIVQTPLNTFQKTVAQYRLQGHDAVWNLVESLKKKFGYVD